MRRTLLSVLSFGLLVATVSPATASVTIGQVAPGSPSMCASPYDYVQPTVSSGNTYVMPGAGTITSWKTRAGTGAGQTLTVKVFRKVADPATYTVVGHDGPRALAQGTLNGFPASIPVTAGDVLGLNSPSVGTDCFFVTPSSDSYLFRMGNLADGEFGAFAPNPTGLRLNISAVFVYSNSFSFRNSVLNKKKGTATLNLTLPNPGELTGTGNGVKAASARAVTSKSVPAGPAQLLIKAKGKKRKRLNETGKVKLNVAVTYTPTGGDPSTQSVKMKLIKR